MIDAPKVNAKRSAVSGNAKPAQLSGMDRSTLLDMLFRRASEHLTADEREWLAQQIPDHVAGLTSGYARMATSVALMADSAGEQSGLVQRDFTSLLFYLAEVLNEVGSLQSIADEISVLTPTRR